MKKILFASVKFIGFLVVMIAFDQYVLCPQFEFLEPKPFNGDILFNPYEGVSFDDAVMANLHAHTTSWGGLTNGEGKPSDIWRRYDSLGYDFHSISQYHAIDRYGDTNKNYIAAYEHGYNCLKTHQLVIGAKNICWKDYIFPQTIHNKQYILQKIARDTSNIIVLNHPAIRSGYNTVDLQLLAYFDFIEVLNPAAQSFAHWDSALSAGKKIFILGNDDIHDIFNNNLMGRCATMVFGTEKQGSKFLYNLKKGNNIAVWLPKTENETLSAKKRKINLLKGYLHQVRVENDTVLIALNNNAQSIRILGNHGLVKLEKENVRQVKIPFEADDTYLRAEISLDNGIKLYLNPIFRTTTAELAERNSIASSLVIQKPPTLPLNILIIMFVLGLLVFLLRKKRLVFKWRKTLTTQPDLIPNMAD